MANPKIENGKVNYMLKTFDGSYVMDSMPIDQAQEMLSRAEVDGSVPGYELVCDAYRFETEKVEMKLSRKSKVSRDEFED